MSDHTVTVTTWYLEQTSPADLVPPAAAAPPEVRFVRAEVPSPEFSRFLYASVGADCAWTDRLPWTYVQWIAYFGLLPAFRGRGIGGQLLSHGIARAWDLPERWPDREPTKRVWVHTCSLDGPYSLANYEKRGFRIFDVKTGEEESKSIEPWPGA
jgi:GNAT superfamily N-acetyltransferase